ncbi:Uroporphyrinogen decarboxylase (URO-D) [Methanohalobium evestigatum Z-7303]|uniref:Uroporphyrinogen decarboxylase (URO-D) n=1 Tax=Methanohalobium evestigatum (strain ATCC BAA-1072 / DSM 3721 / NBRC 107634 / OCM 161 / Z-7303) TaxID=644295 RepID=D7E7S7_METEZ|nr:uroporphyrinogen decarboxylase family protein [Methanohalobium evestigatum]ADI74150.1 Uroporphyrinogen decarboxylase (URO-D) [Methanohalobium evestigatum Z-7303]
MTTRMTSPERMAAVMSGQKPDRVPVVPFIEGYATNITGISLGDFYADGDMCFDAQFASMRLHGYEQTPMYGYASCGAWEFGGKIGFPYRKGQGAPYVEEHPVNKVEDVENLKVPDFRDELPGAYKEADKVAAKCAERGMPVTVQIGSVFTAASVIAETSKFFNWVVTKPDVVHQILDKVSDMFINAVDYFADKYGPKNLLPFDGGPSESNTMISAKMFEEFAYPYVKKIHDHVRERGIPAVLMHPCADQNGNIPYYVKMREENDWSGKYVWLFGPETSIKTQIDAFGDHDVICGNINPPLFQSSSYDEVLELCRENIEEGMNSPSGYILAAGCEFPPNAAPIKVMAMVDAAEMYGKYS